MENLYLGSRGTSVELLQLALERAGIGTGGINGEFGLLTQAALLRYQRSSGLPENGAADPQTWNRLTPYLVGYVRHVARGGETFDSLAELYGSSSAAIRTANPWLSAEPPQAGLTVIVPLDFDVVPVNVSYTSALLSIVIEGLRARYPFLETGSIGTSVLGKHIYCVRIGDGRDSDTKVFYNASHHANEWITTPLLLRFIEEYASAYAKDGTLYDKKASTLYHKAKLFVVPMVNPDGVDLVTGGIPPGSAAYRQAKTMAANYPAVPFPSGWKSNINGVDLNLQYPAGWEIARGHKAANGFTQPGPRDYTGTGPLTEPESASVFRFSRSLRFDLTISYHTQGAVIYWRYLDHIPPKSSEIAVKLTEASGYPHEETPAYSGYAGYKDWFIQTYDRPGYTVEAGRGESPLPLSHFEEIYNENIGIMALGIDMA